MEHMDTAVREAKIVYSEPEVAVLGRVEEFTTIGGLRPPIDFVGVKRLF